MQDVTRGRRVPSPRRLRALARGLRPGEPAGPPDPPPEAGEPAPDAGRAPEGEVMDLVEEPYRSPQDTSKRMNGLEALFDAHGDRRGVFLTIYSRVTDEVGKRIDRDGFRDPDWVADYLVEFADLYREALVGFEAGDLEAVPEAWRIAFETSVRGDVMATQDAMLGVNAHINHDLAFALLEVGTSPRRETRYADHCAVNEVLKRQLDAAQDDLAEQYAPGIDDLDEALGRVDETVAYLTVREGRESAWRAAVALDDTRWGWRERWTRWWVRRTSRGAARFILSPNASGTLRSRLRRAEQGGPRPR